MRIKSLSLIISIIYFIESTGFSRPPETTQNKMSSLRPAALVNSSVGQAEHTVIGTKHFFTYSQKSVDERIEGKDKLIIESIYWVSDLRGLIIAILYYLYYEIPLIMIERIRRLAAKEPMSQKPHTKRLVAEDREILFLDVTYKLPPPFNIIFALIDMAVLASLSFTLLLRHNYSLYLLLISIGITIFIAFLVSILQFDIIDTDFRDLVYAEKIHYLPEFFKRPNLKTATIIGDAHREGIKKYLYDAQARKAGWAMYANSSFLRFLLWSFFDIEASMQINAVECRKGKRVSYNIGTIAGLPGPKELIAKLKRVSTDKMAGQGITTPPEFLPTSRKELNPAAFNAIISSA